MKAATPLHHGCRQTGRQVAKYAAKMVAKNYGKFGDILDLISAYWTMLKNVNFWGQRLNEESRLKKLM